MSDAATRAQALNELGRGEQALAVVGPALAHSPEDVGLLVQAAVALIDLDREQEALPYLYAAAAHAPDSAVVHKLLSLARRGAGDRVGAYDAAVRATQLAPWDANAHVQVAHSASALRDPVNAQAAAAYALKLAPADPAAHLAMSTALFPEGTKPPKDRLVTAEQHVRQALGLRPGDPVALNELARINMARGRLTTAAGQLSSSLRGAPAEEVMQRNMDVVLVALIARFHWVLFAVWFIGGRIVAATRGSLPRWLLVVLGLIGVVAVGYIGWQLRRRIPADMRAGFARGFWRRQKLGAVWGVCLLLTALAFFVAAVSPAAMAQSLFFAGGVPLVIGAVLSWVRFLRQRQS